MAEEKKDLDTRYHEARRDSVAAMVSEQQDASAELVSSLGFDPQSVHASIHMGANGPTLWVYGATKDDGQSAATFISLEQIKQNGFDALYEQMQQEGFGKAVNTALDNACDVPGKQQLDDLQALVNNEVKQHETYAKMEDLKGQVAARDAKVAAEKKLTEVKDEHSQAQAKENDKGKAVVSQLLGDLDLSTPSGNRIYTDANISPDGKLTLTFRDGVNEIGTFSAPVASLDKEHIHAQLSNKDNWSFDSSALPQEQTALKDVVVSQSTTRGGVLSDSGLQGRIAERQVRAVGELAEAAKKEDTLAHDQQIAVAAVSAAPKALSPEAVVAAKTPAKEEKDLPRSPSGGSSIDELNAMKALTPAQIESDREAATAYNLELAKKGQGPLSDQSIKAMNIASMKSFGKLAITPEEYADIKHAREQASPQEGAKLLIAAHQARTQNEHEGHAAPGDHGNAKKMIAQSQTTPAGAAKAVGEKRFEVVGMAAKVDGKEHQAFRVAVDKDGNPWLDHAAGTRNKDGNVADKVRCGDVVALTFKDQAGNEQRGQFQVTEYGKLSPVAQNTPEAGKAMAALREKASSAFAHS